MKKVLIVALSILLVLSACSTKETPEEYLSRVGVVSELETLSASECEDFLFALLMFGGAEGFVQLAVSQSETDIDFADFEDATGVTVESWVREWVTAATAICVTD